MNTTLAIGADVALELVGGRAPTEVRLFRVGENPSVKGTFVFDEAAAVAVMEACRLTGRDWVIADYDHGSLQQKPVDPSKSSKAAGRARVELRKGELWATDIRWTPEAKAGIEAGEWPSISPAFAHGDDMRPTWLINFALTGNPALAAPAELIAASALWSAASLFTTEALSCFGLGQERQAEPARSASAGVDSRADQPPLTTDAHVATPAHCADKALTKTQWAAKATWEQKESKRTNMLNSLGQLMTAKGKTAKDLADWLGVSEDQATGIMMCPDDGPIAVEATKKYDAMMNAVCLSVGLGAGTAQPKLTERLSILAAFERDMLTATKASSQAEALGAVSGLVATEKEARKAIADLAALKTTNIKSTIETALSAAKAERKITPAEFDDQSEFGLRATALSMGDRGEAWLNANLAKRVPHPALVSTYTQPVTVPADVSHHPAVQPGQGGAPATFNGKTWEQLSNPEKHDLRIADPGSYKTLADDYARRNPGKAMTFAHLSAPSRPAPLT